MKIPNHFIIACSLIIGFSSCGVYNQNLMFKTIDDKSIVGDSLVKKIAETEGNYLIHPSDLIELKVYTNNGERLVDPNSEFSTTGIGGGNGGGAGTQGGSIQYNVLANGTVVLPMVGAIAVEGFTKSHLDSVLQLKYAQFYQDVFVSTKCVNRRVIVLGAAGGIGKLSGQVVPLLSEKMHLIEILAMVGGLDDQAKSYNIKLIRGDLANPTVEVIDLSTIEGMKKSNLNVQPNDIIYIERQRKGARQTLIELSPFLSLLTLSTTLIFLFNRK
jgi:polysaccharide export outer membrane protein